jgi:hypothetical protein
MITAYSVFADGLSQTPVFASPLDRGRLFKKTHLMQTVSFEGLGISGERLWRKVFLLRKSS